MRMKTIITVAISLMMMVFFSGHLWAGQVDLLIDKLVEKKILTQSEATALLEEMQKESKKEVKEESKKIKKSSSGWADKVKVKGDVRFRYQTEDKDSSSVSRDRYRVRGRLGIIGKPVDKWEAGIGLATGGDDPRSTNETLDSTFDTPDIRMDYAYVKYSPNKMFSIMGGKIKNPVWGTKDLMWDSDINPEGIAANIKYKVYDNVEIFATPGYFMIDEYKGSSDDPSVLFLQSGVDWKISSKVNLKLAAAYYDFSNIAGNDFSDHSGGGNLTDEYDLWLYDYQATTLDAELGFKLSKGGFMEYLKIFGQYVDSDADSENTGYLFGFKLGDKSLGSLKSWELKVNFRELENDAWLDFLPDSDFYGGATGVEGTEVELKLGITNNVTFALDYYKSEPIDGSDKQELLQADLVVKF